MNNKDRLKDAVKFIVNREVDENIDLWPQIAERIQRKDTVTMIPKWKFAWSTLLVVLALVLVTTIAYALFTYFRNDPGMEAVSQAGLVTDLDVTVVPTSLATATALPPADQIGTARTLKGVTLTLDWVYLDDAWQSIGFSTSGLEADQRLGQVRMSYGGIQPQQYRGAAMSLSPTESGLTGKFLVVQIVRDEKTYGTAETFVNVEVEIPLLDASGKTLDTYRFAVPNVPVHLGAFTGGNTYTVRASSQELRLDWVSMTPQETRALLCSDQDLNLESAALQWARSQEDILLLNQSTTASGQISAALTTENGWTCAEVVFPGEPAPQNLMAFRLVLTSNNAGAPATWEFGWATLPQSLEIPGISPDSPGSDMATEPTPLASQKSGDLQVTLMQAYIDTLRAAVVLRLEGGQPGQYPEFSLTDSQGKPFNTGYRIDIDSRDPNLLSASFTFGDSYNGMFADLNSMPEGRFVGKLVVKTNPSETGGQSFTFDLDLPSYPVWNQTVDQSIISNGLEMRLQKIEMSPSFARMYLCYQRPDSTGDWYIDLQTTTLTIDNASAKPSNFELALAEGYGTDNPPDWTIMLENGRCLIAGFPIGSDGTSGTLTLTVNGLSQTSPEVIPDDQIQIAREKLRQEGIEMDWITVSGTGGGGAGPQITQKPEGMTGEEVISRFFDILGYRFSGHWVFEVTIAP